MLQFFSEHNKLLERFFLPSFITHYAVLNTHVSKGSKQLVWLFIISLI